ncbi:hypothetical protein ABQG65_08825 [Yersinia alsatica]|uniref:hypothetical protein n=1 Tax=Yersinia alsatica TaxID=2890317 RepID=UPI0032EE9D32
MANLDVFLPGVRKYISGPLDIMMTQSVLDAAITFCRESLYCRDRATFNDVIIQEPYTLSDAPEVKCVKRLRVWDITHGHPGELLMAGHDFTALSANQLHFNRPFSLVAVDFAIEPRQRSNEVPDVLADDFSDVIVAGALADLFMMSGKPWTDPQRSHDFGSRFVEGYRRAFREALDNSPITAFDNPVRKHEFF